MRFLLPALLLLPPAALGPASLLALATAVLALASALRTGGAFLSRLPFAAWSAVLAWLPFAARAAVLA